MDISWFWQSLAFELIWKFGVIAGGTYLVALVKDKWPKIFPYIMVGLIGFTCLSLIIFTVTGNPIFTKHASAPTDSNIQQNLIQWSENLELSVVRMPYESNFKAAAIMITTKIGVKIVCGVRNDLPGYLEFDASWIVSKDQLDTLNNMAPDQRKQALDTIGLELARSQYTYRVLSTADAPMQIIMSRQVPVEKMDEYALLTNINGMENEVDLARRAVNLSFQKHVVIAQ